MPSEVNFCVGILSSVRDGNRANGGYEMTADVYADFLARKRVIDPMTGLSILDAIPNYFKPHQTDITRWALRRGRAAIFAGTGLGKALRSDWPVATPDGWRSIGELVVGDPVIGANGRATKVTGVFEQGIRSLVKVTFTDGAETICDESHLWDVNTRGRRHRGLPWRTLTTRQIMDEGIDDQQGKRHFIPICNPVEYPEAELPIDPYTLGVLIGDGSLSQRTVSLMTDKAIINRLKFPFGVLARVVEESDGFAQVNISQGRNGGHIANPLRELLDRLGFEGSKSEDKFIPAMYALASIEQRKELLRGLLDTDGHVRPDDGNIEYGSVSERLANDVADLIRSLGGTAKVRVKENCSYVHNGETRIGQVYYRMSVRLPSDWCPFWVSRKAGNWRPLTKYPPVRAIASVEPAGTAPACCIKVDADDELFVIKNYIVTHNTLMELEWARQVVKHTGKPVLSLAPLAVSSQHIREGEKFGIQATIVRSQSDVRDGTSVTNYQKLPHFDLSQFGGVCLDESSILKSQDGHYRTRLIEECASIPFRLAATATPAPNDFMELGNHAEFLGVMSYTDMLATFFTHDGGETQKWRLKGHAEDAFWKWMASWSVMLRKPSDLGYDDAGYDLPPLREIQHTVGVPYQPSMETGLLFPMEANGLGERIKARRASISERVRTAIDLTPDDRPFVWWCNLNDESAAITAGISGAVEVRGSDDDSGKERKLIDFSEGRIRVLVTKASIAGHGMNWQHCADTGFVGASDSFEQVYQAIRRFWRFGQTKPVNVHFIASELEGAVVANYRRKEADAERMAAALVRHMADLSSMNVRGLARDTPNSAPTKPMVIPSWLGEAA